MASRLLARRFASSAAVATEKKPVNVAVTGAAGAIGYALLMRIARYVSLIWVLLFGSQVFQLAGAGCQGQLAPFSFWGSAIGVGADPCILCLCVPCVARRVLFTAFTLCDPCCLKR